MPTFRVRATSRQAYTQHFEVEAATPEEALELVRQGNVELADERFEYVEDVEPLVVQQVERTLDPTAEVAPSERPPA